MADATLVQAADLLIRLLCDYGLRIDVDPPRLGVGPASQLTDDLRDEIRPMVKPMLALLDHPSERAAKLAHAQTLVVAALQTPRTPLELRTLAFAAGITQSTLQHARNHVAAVYDATNARLPVWRLNGETNGIASNATVNDAMPIVTKHRDPSNTAASQPEAAMESIGQVLGNTRDSREIAPVIAVRSYKPRNCEAFSLAQEASQKPEVAL